MQKGGKPLLYDEKDDIAFIRMNRPDMKNAIDSQCWSLFEEYFQTLLSETRIRALVITGTTPGIFSAGVDVQPSDPLISRLFTALQENDRNTVLEGIAYMQGVLAMLADLPFPTIAAINGLCYSGGCELALACDIRIACQDAVLCFQEAALGLIPDLGGTVRLARLVGPGRAKELIFSARKIDTDEALALGLITHVFTKTDFMRQIDMYVGKLMANGPQALKSVKHIVDAALNMPEKEALAVEKEQATINIMGGQCIEGISAFLEKRTPKWKP
ncbi:MAG: enoyl-CoA hydratase/isomerase family protein [Desulfobacterales bacterium]|nr:enoyl-CoA hydratase/isomerase family protein [Desulfobacterales bacterium]MDX2512468.1 enoyl-CoA hydratase/isomerase family protein [Desulfobacterales bacterium]